MFTKDWVRDYFHKFKLSRISNDYFSDYENKGLNQKVFQAELHVIVPLR